MPREIFSRTILNFVQQPDPWFGLKYSMNLYRGCQHGCIYCDSRSTCYQLGGLDDIRVKTNALELLADQLPRKRMRGTIGFGSMNDPYMPVEREYKLTRGALEIIAENRFPVHLLTKSDLVLRDIDLLLEIHKVYAAVSFTITTADDRLAAELEPGAPRPTARFEAMQALSDAGILTGVTMMPVLPFVEDDPENITAIVEKAHQAGASYLIPAFGVTLRAGSREYFYRQLDQRFPGVKEQYMQRYGNQYQCSSPRWKELTRIFTSLCEDYELGVTVPVFEPENAAVPPGQMKLFED